MSIRLRKSPLARLSLLICVLAATLSGCTAHWLARNAPTRGPAADAIGGQADCLPSFPDAAGWRGGDAAYSIPLPADLARPPDRTSVWLFGDSFVERARSDQGRRYPFIHNTIGISTCRRGGKWSLTTHWKRSDGGPPSAFFEPDPSASWVREALEQGKGPAYYWPFDGFVAHDTLFVGLLRVVPAEPRGPFNLPFRLAGMDLARIENPQDPPDQWQIRRSILSDSTSSFPGSAFVVDGGYVYAFTFFDREDGRSPRGLTRISLRSLRAWQPDLSTALETLGDDGRWLDGFRPDRAKILMEDDGTEMSVHFDPALDRWLAVYASPRPRPRTEGLPPGVIRLREAPHLTGPWSPPVALHEMSETRTPGIGEPDPNLFCYAAKAHPQFAPAGRLLVTYVCNLFARSEDEVSPILDRLANSPELYRAKAVSVPIPFAPEEDSSGD